MKKFRLIALLLVLCLLLSGCGILDVFYMMTGGLPFQRIPYERPDISSLTLMADECTTLSETATDIEELYPKLEEYLISYIDFYTQYLVAYVHYCQDMTDLYWSEEYTYCEAQTAQVQAERERLMYTLAACPLREELEGEEYFGEGYFDDYDGQNIWTEALEALMTEESALISQYYTLAAQLSYPLTEDTEDPTITALEELYVQLVLLRQQIAREAGYDHYGDFAYEHTYYRDYTVEEAQTYCNSIAETLKPLYVDLAQSDYWLMPLSSCSQQQTLNYVRKTARNMGGVVQEAFSFMNRYKLYDIEQRANKLDSSFEVYFYYYGEPFVFVSPLGNVDDQLTFVHEFGHFCNDYASYGSQVSIDSAEVFSQGMEFLSLSYGQAEEELVRTKMADSLCVYVEQATYSSFEQQVYGLPEAEVTPEKIRSIFEETTAQFGLDTWDFDSRMYLTITHFFTQPMYVISYVVSNDAALQLYQLEQQETGAGLQVFTEALDSEQLYFLAFLEEAGLESPFTEGRVPEVAETFRNVLIFL